MAYVNSGPRMRGGRGRGFVQNHIYIPYTRTDQNKFQILSNLQDGDGSFERSDGVDSDGFTKVRKRQRVNTGGDDNYTGTLDSQPPDPQPPDSDLDIDFDNMDMGEKLSTIFITLTCNQKKITHVEQKIDSINILNGRVQKVETVMNSYNERLKLLEYKSIDIEARSRRNNLLFRGFLESRDEDCRRVIRNFLEEKLGVDELPAIERAHRLGRFNRLKRSRPIILAFSFYTDTEEILSLAGSLKGTSFSINRDYPMEITNARRTLWPQFKSARAHPTNRVSIVYPAKLLVNGRVACDMFPDWDLIMKGSRISIDQSEPQNKPGGTSGSYIPPTTNDRISNRDSHPGTRVEFMDTQEHVSRPLSTPSMLTPHNLNDFMPGQGRGFSMGVGRGRGLIYEQESSSRNTASRGPWGNSDPLRDAETLNAYSENDQSAKQNILPGTVADSEQFSSTPVHSKPDSDPKLSVCAPTNSAKSPSSINNSLTSAHNSSAQLNQSNSDHVTVKPKSNSGSNPTTPQSQDGKQSSASKQSDKPPARPVNQGFMSPGSLADSLLGSLREHEVAEAPDLATGRNGTHRSRSKQRSFKKPLSRSISVKKGSSSKSRSQTPADRNAVTRESKSRANSVEPQSPKMK